MKDMVRYRWLAGCIDSTKLALPKTLNPDRAHRRLRFRRRFQGICGRSFLLSARIALALANASSFLGVFARPIARAPALALINSIFKPANNRPAANSSATLPRADASSWRTSDPEYPPSAMKASLSAMFAWVKWRAATKGSGCRWISILGPNNLYSNKLPANQLKFD